MEVDLDLGQKAQGLAEGGHHPQLRSESHRRGFGLDEPPCGMLRLPPTGLGMEALKKEAPQ